MAFSFDTENDNNRQPFRMGANYWVLSLNCDITDGFCREETYGLTISVAPGLTVTLKTRTLVQSTTHDMLMVCPYWGNSNLELLNPFITLNPSAPKEVELRVRNNSSETIVLINNIALCYLLEAKRAELLAALEE